MHPSQTANRAHLALLNLQSLTRPLHHTSFLLAPAARPAGAGPEAGMPAAVREAAFLGRTRAVLGGQIATKNAGGGVASPDRAAGQGSHSSKATLATNGQSRSRRGGVDAKVHDGDDPSCDGDASRWAVWSRRQSRKASPTRREAATLLRSQAAAHGYAKAGRSQARGRAE